MMVTRSVMTRELLGMLLGLGFANLDILMMLPFEFADKGTALLGAFCSRFALGFFVATVRLSTPPILTGLIVGVLTSLPDAVITKSYIPILGSGLLFGALAGWVVGRFGNQLDEALSRAESTSSGE